MTQSHKISAARTASAPASFRVVALALLAVLAAPAVAQESESEEKPETMETSLESQIGLHAGIGGAGIHADYPISENLRIRAVGNYLKWDYDDESGGTTYKGDLNLQSYGLAADWHPFKSGFRVGLGAFLNKNEVDASAEDTMLDIGNDQYNARVNANIKFKNFAPYAGIGYGGNLAPGLNFYLDIGALYTDEPELSLNGSERTTNCTFSVDKDSNASVSGNGCPGDLADDIAREHREANDDIKKVKFFPVAAFGISYRF